jgi:diacylglycerol O-acyltransferase / wax synthase
VSDGQRFSSADTAWLHMDRPGNLMVINSVLRFAEPLDWERLAAVVRRRLVERYPRFRERVAESRVPGRGASWRSDTSFDLQRHLHRRALPAPSGEAELRALAGDLASMPLDRDKPLWDMYLIDGPGEGSSVIVRMHHCIADGIALAQVMLSLTDSAPDAEGAGEQAAEARAQSRGPRASVGEWLRGVAGAALAPVAGAASAARGASAALAREGVRVLERPPRAVELVEGAAAGGRALAKLLLAPSEGGTALKGELGTARAVAWSEPISLAEVKRIARAHGATVNDVLLAAVSGALREHLLACGEQPCEVHALIPVNLRAGAEVAPDELGNRFGLVLLTLPVDEQSRARRLSELKRRMGEIKRSPEAPVSYLVLEAIGLTPSELESRLVDVFTAKATAVMTNVPGPREPVYLAGSRLRSVLVWAPTSGSIGMSVSIFSYDGEITIGLLVHAALIAHPGAVLERVSAELAALGRRTRALGRRAPARRA